MAACFPDNSIGFQMPFFTPVSGRSRTFLDCVWNLHFSSAILLIFIPSFMAFVPQILLEASFFGPQTA